MPINPNIILGIKPMQFQMADPLDSASKSLALQGLMGQRDMQEMQMRQAQQAEADDMATRDAFRAGGDQKAIIDRLMGAGQYKPAQALQKNMLETREKEGAINKTRAETMGKLLGFQKESAGALMANPTPENALAAVDQFERMATSFGMPELGQQAAQQRAAIQAAGNNPEALKRMAAGWALAADKFLPQIEMVSDGKTMRAVDKNFLSNPNAGTQTIAMLTTPGQDQVDARTRAEGAANREVQLSGQLRMDARQAEANRIAAEGNVVKTETDLRKEFADLPEVKRYKAALPSFKAIENAAKSSNPQADINLIYGLAKLYDPESVVREGEYATIANSQAIPERIKSLAQSLAGKGKLTPETKRQILAEAAGRIATFETEYSGAKKSFEEIAQGRGGNPKNVFPAISPSNAKPPAPTNAPITATNAAGQKLQLVNGQWQPVK